MKSKINSLLFEGMVFCGGGLWLLSYSLTSQAAAFNKDWAQSPYLFPLIISVCTIILSLWIMIDGIKKTRAAVASDPHFEVSKLKYVGIVLVLCCLYYIALKYLKMPYVTVGILNFYFTFCVFEVVTLIFLILMMAIMGVRKIPILVLVPLGVTLFLSIAFRTMLHVLLP